MSFWTDVLLHGIDDVGVEGHLCGRLWTRLQSRLGQFAYTELGVSKASKLGSACRWLWTIHEIQRPSFPLFKGVLKGQIFESAAALMFHVITWP